MNKYLVLLLSVFVLAATATLGVRNATPIVDSLSVSPSTVVPWQPITVIATARDCDEHGETITGWRIRVTDPNANQSELLLSTGPQSEPCH